AKPTAKAKPVAKARPAAKTAARNPLRKTTAKPRSSGSSVAKRMAKAVSRLSASSAAAASVPGTNGSGGLTVVR
ncbi:MAG: hypothetical protein ACKO1Q_13270, partial [Vulcanococcus sp.]